MKIGAIRLRPPFQVRNRYLLIGDLILIATSVLASFAIRLDLGQSFNDYLPSAIVMLVVALIIKPVVYYAFGLYRRYWAYASIRELRIIFASVTTASVVVASVILLIAVAGGLEAGFPRMVIVIDWLLSILAVGGLRLVIRILAESGQISQKGNGRGRAKRVVIVGAGDAGALVVREMQRNPQLNMIPVAFVDDEKEKQGKDIHGVRVAGPIEDVPKVVRDYMAQEVVIAIPTAPGSLVRFLTDLCQRNRIPFMTMPGIYELIGGKVSINRLREVDIGDLLRREPVMIDDQMVGRTLTGKRVLITGAGGSIGLELCRQVARWRPDQMVLLGHGENSIFEALIELRDDQPDLPLIPIIADVRDPDRVFDLFMKYRPEVLFHTAAHKHVPLMEINPEEAVTNNVLGTRNVVNAARAANTERFVFISTDKAVQPMSVYGATKRMAELIVRDASLRSRLPYVSVRFGNVLGSRGSIVPIFQRQIARGGPVTVTHPEMERFFMTIPEAVHLVLQASGMGSGGELFVLRMGEQISILSLAEDMIRLSGLEPYRDISIVFTGIRPGEKISEALWDEGMEYEPTSHPDIVCVQGESELLEGEELNTTVSELLRLAREGDSEAIVGLLSQRVPAANLLDRTPPPDLTSVL